jgi:glycosyltransferase involved in cell wall biosynthesis
MNIVFFYSEVMGYTLAVIKSLVKDHGAEVHVVYWDKGIRSAFELPLLTGVQYYKRSEMTVTDLENLLSRLAPKILYVSGRMDKGYLTASRTSRAKGTLVISGFDAQWKPTLKNYLIVACRSWWYKKYFDFIWIPGPYQYEFAKKLGYSDQQVIWNLYSADTDLFTIDSEHEVWNKRFVFTGRLAEEKGIKILIQAFENTKKIKPHDWQLLLIGNGPLSNQIEPQEAITVVNFMQPQQLLENMKEGGVFILPSTQEPWGVVLHEYAAAGFPIICTDACGAATSFVKNKENGFVVQAGNVEQLTQAMLQIIDLPYSVGCQMKKRSRELSQAITPRISASSLLAVLRGEEC